MTETKSTMTVSTPSDFEIRISRVFAAPRQLVFDAFTRAEHMQQWWGPKGWTLPVCKVDLKPGGSFSYTMQGPAGETHDCSGEYIEVSPPERVVYTDGFDAPAMADYASTVTVVFEELEPKLTRITLTSVFKSKEIRDAIVKMGFGEGWGESFERLDEVFETAAV